MFQLFRTYVPPMIARVFCSCLLLAVPVCGNAQIEGAVGEALVRIESIRPSGNSTSRSISAGFVFQDKNHIVTCLHTVYGATSIRVYYEGARVSRRAEIERCLASADLALLSVENVPDDAAPLEKADAPAVRNDDVMVWGYPGGLKAPQDYECRVKHATGQTLKDVLNSDQQDILEAIGLYDLDLKLLHLQATLTSGCSGGPVLDAEDNVVGVVCGGLEKGASSVSWAVPATELPKLLNSAPGLADLGGSQTLGRLATLFSADLRASDSPVRIRASDYTFVRARTRTMGELLHTADNMMQIQSIVNFFASTVGLQDNFMNRRLDIYECIQNGAVLVLPEDIELKDNEDVSNEFYSDAENGFELRVRCGGFENVNAAVLGSQRLINFSPDEANEPFFAQQDNAWSDVFPWIRWDGVIAQRRSIFTTYQFSQRLKRLFGLVYIRPAGGTAELLQVVVLNHRADPLALTPARLQDWAEWMLCVQLSGFAQGLNRENGAWRQRQQ